MSEDQFKTLETQTAAFREQLLRQQAELHRQEIESTQQRIATAERQHKEQRDRERAEVQRRAREQAQKDEQARREQAEREKQQQQLAAAEQARLEREEAQAEKLAREKAEREKAEAERGLPRPNAPALARDVDSNRLLKIRPGLRVLLSPIPLTFFRSSALRNGRAAIMRAAITCPIPGTVVSSFSVAVLMSILPSDVFLLHVLYVTWTPSGSQRA